MSPLPLRMWCTITALFVIFGLVHCHVEKEASRHIGQLTAVEIEDELQVFRTKYIYYPASLS